MGMAVGSLYVRSHFDENSKEEANDMIEDIREAFLEILKEVDWMDEETKNVAKMKAETMEQKIGFPEYIFNSTELDAEYDGVSSLLLFL
ncbi:neprilysin-like protein [Leptotrombidium deliense]|uniref:Neprilysin-like protein n=1 Tax=Leptotrombidium deliense TaxID=299467 RepID=A0A443RVQ2_9ACAR|nr:neprilysin-like protein [Leptotrombidium deliense]